MVEWRRVKNIMIIILLLINGFLLVLVGSRRSESQRYERSALNGSIQVLAYNGIELRESAISARGGQAGGTTERDLRMENKIASILLGEEVEGTDRGGGLVTYATGRGQISIRAGGELTSRLEDQPYWYTSDPENHAASLMERLGVESRLAEAELLDGSGTVVYQQMLDGVPLFSCRLCFVYEGGRLAQLSGNLLAVDSFHEEDGELLSLPTVLMRFLDDVLSSGDVCSAILAVEPGYRMTQSFTNTIRLQPVWYISTNTADYYVDGITGELSRVNE